MSYRPKTLIWLLCCGAQPTVSPRAKRKTWDISDPCREPRADLDAFRQARDEINNRIAAYSWIIGVILLEYAMKATTQREIKSGCKLV
jgi:hypothetical protein